jgi:hypothetical protein
MRERIARLRTALDAAPPPLPPSERFARGNDEGQSDPGVPA